ncbi:hypothetical protein ABT301_35530 [Streptomyces sp. NPDC000987]|uniref:hypothetical protein n=1 Tax=Streptomyces sp. NPDC000987 TaxID=3154374 RepID=UPI00331FAC1A
MYTVGRGAVAIPSPMKKLGWPLGLGDQLSGQPAGHRERLPGLAGVLTGAPASSNTTRAHPKTLAGAACRAASGYDPKAYRSRMTITLGKSNPRRDHTIASPPA